MKQAKMTPEDYRSTIEYWQKRKARARKQIRDVALIGCPIFMTCSEELNRGLMEKKKETMMAAKREIQFVDANIAKLKKVI
jgi:hypothetical protein